MYDFQPQLMPTVSRDNQINQSQKSGDLQKRLNDPKFSYGYFANRSKLHKQVLPSYALEYISSKKLDNKLPIYNIQVNNSQTRVYASFADGMVKFM